MSHEYVQTGTIFDLETKPDQQKALELMPYFDEKAVKCGNMVDKDKIRAKIEDARDSHEKDWMEEAALRPETANICAIGYFFPNGPGYVLETIKSLGSEKALIEDFWTRFKQYTKTTGKPFLGFNIEKFDVMMLIIRSRILGIAVPFGIMKGRYLDSSRLLDLRSEWLCGRNPLEVKSSLGYVAKAFGVGGKEASGKEFGALLESDEIAAMQYLYNDIALTKKIAEKFGYEFPEGQSFEKWLTGSEITPLEPPIF